MGVGFSPRLRSIVCRQCTSTTSIPRRSFEDFSPPVCVPSRWDTEANSLCYSEILRVEADAARMSKNEPQRVYKIIFHNQGEVFEIYAKNVNQGHLYGFVEVEEILYGERSQVVVDPSEERMKSEFRGVKRIFLPMHAVVRIDEVEKEGVPRITTQEGAGNISEFPSPIYPPQPPRGDSGKS